jgi:hypothetical protein
MKNKLWMAALGAALVCGLVLGGCEEKVMDVKIVPDTVKVGAVTATKTTTGNKVIVAWDAIDNVPDYDVYLKVDGAKTVVSVGTGDNAVIYAVADGSTTANTNIDKWSCLFDLSNLAALPAGTAVKFGVEARTPVGGSYMTVSEIAWSNTITK